MGGNGGRGYILGQNERGGLMKICEICKKEFEPKHFREKCCCDECKREAHRIKVRQNHQERRRKKPEEPKKIVKLTPLASKNELARKSGLSYGQLQAMRYLEEHRLEV